MPDAETPSSSITCPVCGKTSYNKGDIAYGYCGRCKAFTGESETIRQQRVRHRSANVRNMKLVGLNIVLTMFVMPFAPGTVRFIVVAATWICVALVWRSALESRRHSKLSQERLWHTQAQGEANLRAIHAEVGPECHLERPWHEWPRPGRKHYCLPVSSYLGDDASLTYRCACGAVGQPTERGIKWRGRNSRSQQDCNKATD